jgi:hypothetical protein
MKNLGFLFLVTALALGVVACGNKDKSSGSATSFSSDPYKVSTVVGYLDVSQPIVVVGNVTYQLSQNSYAVVNQALNLAHQQGIQPVMINGVQKLKANITGSLVTQNQQYPQQQYPQQYPQQNTGNILNVTQAVVIR